ncbi:MAG: hypothetical protein ABIQ16_02775 [Polyangiaceae bacterium]
MITARNNGVEHGAANEGETSESSELHAWLRSLDALLSLGKRSRS